MAKIYGELEKAQLENVTVTPTVGVTGRAVVNTVLNKVQVDDGVAVRNAVTEDGPGVITAKDIDGGTMTNTNRLAVPKGTTAGLDALTDKEAVLAYDTEKKLFQGNDGTGWSDVGAGGSGGLNVVSQNAFEFNIDGVSSSHAGLTYTHDTSTQLTGAGSLKLTQANGPGPNGEHFIIDAFTRTADAPIAMMKTSFEVVTSDDVDDYDYTPYIRDITNGVDIPMLPEGLLAGSGFYNGSWQTPAGALSYEVRIRAELNSTTILNLTLDNYQTEKYAPPVGTVVTESKTYTPTGSWTGLATYTGATYRVGEYLHGWVKILCGGAPTGGTLDFNLPSGLTIDTSKLPSSAASSGDMGDVFINDTDGGNPIGNVAYSSTTSLRCRFVTENGTYPTHASVNPTTPITFANGDYVEATFKVPIVGWGAQAILGEDSGQRAVIFRAHKPSGTQIINGTALVSLTTVDEDSAGAFASSSFTAPFSGRFLFNYGAWIEQLTPIGAIRTFLLKNGIGTQLALDYKEDTGVTSGEEAVLNGSVELTLVKGDVISLYAQSAGNPVNIKGASDNYTYMSGHAIQSPQQIAAGEKVVAVYQDSSNQNANSVPFTFNTKIKDTHNALSGGVFTCPRSGSLTVNLHLRTENINGTIGDGWHTIMRVNGSNTVRGLHDYVENTTSRPYTTGISITYPVSKGDTIDFIASADASIAASKILASTQFNTVSFSMD